MQEESKYSYIAKSRSSKIVEKLDIYKLLEDSYAGGYKYLHGGHLDKYPREHSTVHKERVKRSLYFNYLQPIIDLLVGFMFSEEVEREYPSRFEYIINKTSKRKAMDPFMQAVMTKAFLYTTGVLVDSPKFNPEEYPTLADRDEKLNPYACIYTPFQIRNFSVTEDLELSWVLLDNSMVDSSDPFSAPVKKRQYRLWTPEYYQDFDIKEDGKKEIVIPYEEVRHNIGYVPFHFVNTRDIDDDYITDSPMEDVAIISRQIYRCISLLDEMLHNGTFKTLFYPTMTADDIPDSIKMNGIYDIPLATFNGETSQPPFFAGADLGNIAPYKEAINVYILEIFRKIGMDQDRDKTYVQSGAAMAKEFQKTEALLRSASEAAEAAEKFIIKTAARWENIILTDEDVKIEYTKKYQQDDIDIKLKRLYDMFALSYKNIQDEALKEIVKINLPESDADDIVANAEKIEPVSWLTNNSDMLATTQTEVK